MDADMKPQMKPFQNLRKADFFTFSFCAIRETADRKQIHIINKRRTNSFSILNYNEKEAYLLQKHIYFEKKRDRLFF